MNIRFTKMHGIGNDYVYVNCFQETVENPVEVEMYMIASELTQLDGVEAGEVPAEAKNDAINYEKEISMLENE